MRTKKPKPNPFPVPDKDEARILAQKRREWLALLSEGKMTLSYSEWILMDRV